MSAASRSLFRTGDRLAFARDEWGRLRLTVPEDRLPFAAWLHGDVQANLSLADVYRSHLEAARAQPELSMRRVRGNGCQVSFWENDWVELASVYERWAPAWILVSELFAMFDAWAGYLTAEARAGWSRPEPLPAVYRGTVAFTNPETGTVGEQNVVDHTFFPDDWGEEDVVAAGRQAWESGAFAADLTTGAWSGMAGSLEIAGYLHPESWRVDTFYPVIPG